MAESSVQPTRCKLTLKLVAMATSLDRSDKEGQILNLRSNTYQKFGGNMSSRFWDNLSQGILNEGCTPLAS